TRSKRDWSSDVCSSDLIKRLEWRVKILSTIGSVLEWSVRNYPEKTALIYETKDQSWTYKELNENVNRLAYSLQQLGVEKGDVVSTFLYNSSDFIVTLFASAKIGAVFNMINYRLVAYDLQYILNDANTKVLIYEDDVEEIVHATVALGVNVEHFVHA